MARNQPLIGPEIVESVSRKLRVAARMRYLPMPKVMLNSSSIVPLVCQVEPRSVS